MDDTKSRQREEDQKEVEHGLIVTDLEQRRAALLWFVRDDMVCDNARRAATSAVVEEC